MATVDWALLTDSGVGATRWVAWARIARPGDPTAWTFTCTSSLGTPRSEYICVAYRNAGLGSYQHASGSGATVFPPDVPDAPGTNGLIVGLCGHHGFVTFSSGTGTTRGNENAVSHAYAINAQDLNTATNEAPHGTYSGVDIWEGSSISLHAKGGVATSFIDVTEDNSGVGTIPRSVDVPAGVIADDLLILWIAYNTPTGVISLVDDQTPGAIYPGAATISKASIQQTFGLR